MEKFGGEPLHGTVNTWTLDKYYHLTCIVLEDGKRLIKAISMFGSGIGIASVQNERDEDYADDVIDDVCEEFNLRHVSKELGDKLQRIMSYPKEALYFYNKETGDIEFLRMDLKLGGNTWFDETTGTIKTADSVFTFTPRLMTDTGVLNSNPFPFKIKANDESPSIAIEGDGVIEYEAGKFYVPTNTEVTMRLLRKRVEVKLKITIYEDEDYLSTLITFSL